jgi:hypothetical protein
MSIFQKWLYPSIKKINFEDVKHAVENPTQFIIINTLPIDDQSCLILTTLPIEKEEVTMNSMLDNIYTDKRKIIVYGKNNCDESSETKYKQLIQLGFSDIYIYCGGLFEWLLLQDIYGKESFPTTTHTLKLLDYKPKKTF